MLFLVAGFVCSALVSLILKVADRKDCNRYGMLTINYASCIIPFLLTQAGKPLPEPDADFALCLGFAAVNSLFYLAGMVVNQLNVRRNGAILQSTFARLGVMVPTCLSIFLFGERPSLVQLAGIILVLFAFIIMNLPEDRAKEKSGATKPSFSLLVSALLLGGLADSLLKVFQQYGNRTLEDWFMGATFLSASISCLVMTSVRKERIGRKEITFGLCLGIPNYLSSLFLLKSLSTVSAYIAYPTYSVGAILVVTAASCLIFKEKLTGWSMAGVAMIIPAVILLNT